MRAFSYEVAEVGFRGEYRERDGGIGHTFLQSFHKSFLTQRDILSIYLNKLSGGNLSRIELAFNYF